jgi:hypothetical protein
LLEAVATCSGTADAVAGTNAAAKMVRECTSRSATILARYSFSFQFLQSSIFINNNTTTTLTTTTLPGKKYSRKKLDNVSNYCET